jgi:hypothetical protein
MRLLTALLTCLALASTGCSTTQTVQTTKTATVKMVRSVAQAPQAGNSPQMDGHLQTALLAQGLVVRKMPMAGTRQATDADALISYVDVWRWDIAMYMQSITLQLHDADTGELLASATWQDSFLHAFRDPGPIVTGLVDEMFARLRASKPSVAQR